MSELDKFQVTSLRGPKLGVYEQLLATKLSMANHADPLKRVILVSEAVWFIGKEKAKELDIDLNMIDILYRVAMSLENTGPVLVSTIQNYDPVKAYVISWAFDETEENYRHYINPWVKDPSVICYQVPSINEKKTKWEKEFETWRWLVESGWRTLTNMFVAWAAPLVTEIEAKISTLISSKAWLSLQALKEEVKEEGGEESLGDQMGQGQQ